MQPLHRFGFLLHICYFIIEDVPLCSVNATHTHSSIKLTLCIRLCISTQLGPSSNHINCSTNEGGAGKLFPLSLIIWRICSKIFLSLRTFSTISALTYVLYLSQLVAFMNLLISRHIL